MLSLHHLLIVCLLCVILLVLRVHGHLSLSIWVIHHLVIWVHLLRPTSRTSRQSSPHATHHLGLWICHHHLLILHRIHWRHALHHHARRHSRRHHLPCHSRRIRVESGRHGASILLIGHFINLLRRRCSIVLILLK